MTGGGPRRVASGERRRVSDEGLEAGVGGESKDPKAAWARHLRRARGAIPESGPIRVASGRGRRARGADAGGFLSAITKLAGLKCY